jgi:hypothetical protein
MSESEESLLDSIGTVMIAMKVALFLKQGRLFFTIKELRERKLPIKNAILIYETQESFEIAINKEIYAGCLTRERDNLAVTDKGLQYYRKANHLIEENLHKA